MAELEDECRVELREGKDQGLQLAIERAVDPLSLTIEKNTGLYEALADGGRRKVTAIRVPGNGNIRPIDFTAALTFLTDIPFAVGGANAGRELGHCFRAG